jgi:hypothetical protein
VYEALVARRKESYNLAEKIKEIIKDMEEYA